MRGFGLPHRPLLAGRPLVQVEAASASSGVIPDTLFAGTPARTGHGRLAFWRARLRAARLWSAMVQELG